MGLLSADFKNRCASIAQNLLENKRQKKFAKEDRVDIKRPECAKKGI